MRRGELYSTIGSGTARWIDCMRPTNSAVVAFMT